eukprot:TRINITY_DN10732_c0_g1_i1.p1 TRINITY_DN10732_c0_g1~~TRINITY_DN10732_c0_g1_i1.p1  ORF type:complete len:646 (-),score=100.66 TRINITY_DN10732_c0_g1_i1:67-2004(-)
MNYKDLVDNEHPLEAMNHIELDGMLQFQAKSTPPQEDGDDDFDDDDDDQSQPNSNDSKKRKRNSDDESSQDAKKRKGLYMCNICHQEKKGHICNKMSCCGGKECRAPWKHTPHGRRARWQTSKGKQSNPDDELLLPNGIDLPSHPYQASPHLHPLGMSQYSSGNSMATMAAMYQIPLTRDTSENVEYSYTGTSSTHVSAITELADALAHTDNTLISLHHSQQLHSHLTHQHDTGHSHVQQQNQQFQINSNRQQLIIDTDGAVDDVIGILMALTHQDQADLCAITTVFGKIDVSQATENVNRMLDMFAPMKSVPVYKGCEGPIVNFGKRPTWDAFYGSNGLGDYIFPAALPKSNRPTDHAVATLVKLINQNPGVYSIVILGPMTNLALAVRLDPGIANKVKMIIFMGGSTNGKTNSMNSEQNICCDAEAAHIVLQSFNSPIFMVSWELSIDCGLSWGWYDEWIKSSKQEKNGSISRDLIREFICHITSKYELIARKRLTSQNNISVPSKEDEEGPRFNMCDSLAVALALAPALILESMACFVCVELSGAVSRGSTLIDWNGRMGEKNVFVITSVNKEGLKKIWEDMLMFDVKQNVAGLNGSGIVHNQHQRLLQQNQHQQILNVLMKGSAESVRLGMVDVIGEAKHY